MKFVVGFSHLPNRSAARDAMYSELLRSIFRDGAAHQLVGNVEISVRAPNWAWSEMLWEKALAEAERLGATDCLFFQDDLVMMPSGMAVIAAMCAGRPLDAIAFDCAHPHARTVFMNGKCGYTTCDGLVGLGYRLTVPDLKDFLAWRRYELEDDAPKKITEDSLIGLWAIARGRRFFHPTPAPFDHALDVDSTYQNERHGYRRPQVIWSDVVKLPDEVEFRGELLLNPAWWARDVDHLGRFYMNLHGHLPLLLRDKPLAERRMLEADADVCPKWARKFFYNLASLESA